MKNFLLTVKALSAVFVLIGSAYLALLFVQNSIAEEAKGSEQAIEIVRQEANYGSNEDAIWRTQHQLEQIEERREDGSSYSWDERREKQLVRTMDILLQKQDAMLDKYEILSK